MKIPARRASPPVRWVKVPVCPECGEAEIGVIYLENSYCRVLSWWDAEKASPDETEEEDKNIIETKGYYCCYCGEEFESPEIMEEAQ
jgi:hypothetical protein